MTVKECIEAALPLIHISSEARSVEITWHEDGAYSLKIISEGWQDSVRRPAEETKDKIEDEFDKC